MGLFDGLRGKESEEKRTLKQPPPTKRMQPVPPDHPSQYYFRTVQGPPNATPYPSSPSKAESNEDRIRRENQYFIRKEPKGLVDYKGKKVRENNYTTADPAPDLQSTLPIPIEQSVDLAKDTKLNSHPRPRSKQESSPISSDTRQGAVDKVQKIGTATNSPHQKESKEIEVASAGQGTSEAKVEQEIRTAEDHSTRPRAHVDESSSEAYQLAIFRISASIHEALSASLAPPPDQNSVTILDPLSVAEKVEQVIKANNNEKAALRRRINAMRDAFKIRNENVDDVLKIVELEASLAVAQTANESLKEEVEQLNISLRSANSEKQDMNESLKEEVEQLNISLRSANSEKQDMKNRMAAEMEGVLRSQDEAEQFLIKDLEEKIRKMERKLKRRHAEEKDQLIEDYETGLTKERDEAHAKLAATQQAMRERFAAEQGKLLKTVQDHIARDFAELTIP